MGGGGWSVCENTEGEVVQTSDSQPNSRQLSQAGAPSQTISFIASHFTWFSSSEGVWPVCKYVPEDMPSHPANP